MMPALARGRAAMEAVRPALARALAGRQSAALLFGGLCCVLAAIVGIELASAGDDPVATPAAAVQTAAAPALPPPRSAFALPPISAYAEVGERPLFSATRQPAPAEAGQDLLGKSSSFVLLGVILTEEGRAALVKHGDPGELARLKEGEALEGWTVQTILPDHIVLQHGATEVELKLKDRPAPAGTPHLQRQPAPRS